ncbi:MAG: amidohydrolase family protein [Longimicrobiaceae bacterium]
MPFNPRRAAAWFPVLLLLLLHCPIAAQQPTLALVGGRVIDGYGGPPIEDGVVLISGERIVAVGPRREVAVPSGTRIISTEGMTVLPGLFDMHVHLMLLGHGDYERWQSLYGSRMVDLVMPTAARQLLMAGVTSARDLGAVPEEILAVKRRIDAGEIPGPRLFVAGAFIQHAPYQEYETRYRWGVNGPEDARRKVQRLVDAGAQMIKLIDQDQMTEAEVAAVVQAARRNRVPIVAHAHREEEIRIGLRHGVDNFEHTGLGTAPRYPEDIVEGLRRRNASLYWTPTISPLFVMRYTAEEFPERLDDPAWQEGMPAELAAEIRESLRSIPHLPYYALFPARIPHLPTKFQQLRESGVQLMIGTDAGIPSIFHNDATWREMALWVKLGVPPMQVIQAATLWPARFLGVQQELGTLAPGRLADVIAVRGDPLTNMEVLRDVQVVVKGGQRIK